MDNFQKTVNLKDKAEKERQRMLYGEPEKVPARHALQGEAGGEKKVKSKAEEIDEIYERKNNVSSEDNLRKISRPIVKNVNEKLYKRVVAAALILILSLAVYFMFFRNSENNDIDQSNIWYKVNMKNGEVYYGQIENKTTDPVAIKNVYYDYDLLNKTENKDESSGIRLVKKGKETYGPSGVIEVYQDNIQSFELLSTESKALKAILDYESKNK